MTGPPSESPSEPMPSDPTPNDCPTNPSAPDREITLEEWIAAGQGCCGSAADGGSDATAS